MSSVLVFGGSDGDGSTESYYNDLWRLELFYSRKNHQFDFQWKRLGGGLAPKSIGTTCELYILRTSVVLINFDQVILLNKLLGLVDVEPILQL